MKALTNVAAKAVIDVTIPDVAIQATKAVVEKQATMDSNTDPAVQEESIDSAKKETGQVEEPGDQSEEKISDKPESRSTVTGTWVTFAWSFDDTSED